MWTKEDIILGIPNCVEIIWKTIVTGNEHEEADAPETFLGWR